jgi:hypothetical protein
MPKHDFSFADVRAAANSSMPVPPVGTDRSRVGMVSSGNENVLREASNAEPYGRERIRSGPAWEAGLRAATKPMNLPGNSNRKNMRRKPPITY